uniref:NADH:ubiquinone reductase (H(+)-translocating) n=2 Tax=Xenos TaxID=32435 RepID=A0A7T1WRH1_9NEOP|nr:NADH dehydrogenase subunit 5 [Xenos yangi]QPP04705.1 NADH dehydrogenase subunit 5 [Xenos cf. moutoni RZ-2020]UXG18682.1 NADH dehydrogenase subunit 5 [Xenos yangi]
MYFKMSLIIFYSLMYFLFMMMYFDLFIEWEIFMSNSLDFGFIMILDWMSMVFLFILFIISLSVIIYSKEYMYDDKFNNRFIILIMLFILSMVFLIISPNFIMVLLGWDGLGLISFCLISFYQNVKSLNASIITFFFNRMGDSFIYVMLFFILKINSYNFYFYEINKFGSLSLMCLFFACMTKSAQVPFSVWLPLAMAAPTPVSSLVHSSTLVTSGVFLLIRFESYIYLNSFFEVLFVITLLLSSISACLENDMKKIIALSTLSQLSLMMVMLMEGFLEVCFLHLLVHAAIKCLLFLCSGYIIHSFNSEQDIRMLSSFVSFYPVMIGYLNISFMSLMGLPFLSAYYTKDFFLEIMYLYSFNSLFVMVMIYFSIMLTVLYSFRLIYNLNFSWFYFSPWVNFFKDYNFIISLFILLFISLVMGSLMMWMISLSMNLFLLNLWVKLFVYFIMFYGYFISFNKFKSIYFQNLFFFEDLINQNKYFYLWMNLFNKMVEIGWGEKIGGMSIYLNYKNMVMNYFNFHLLKSQYIFIFFIIFMFYLI